MGGKWPNFRQTVGTSQNRAPKLHPKASGEKGRNRNFLAKTRAIIKFRGPWLHVYEISSPFMPQFGQHRQLKFGIFFFAKLAESNCGAVKLLVELQIRISQRIMHLFSRGKKPRLDNFVVLLTQKIFIAKNGRKMAYFSLDCRYTPELGTKSAPPGVGQKRAKTNFFFKNETH